MHCVLARGHMPRSWNQGYQQNHIWNNNAKALVRKMKGWGESIAVAQKQRAWITVRVGIPIYSLHTAPDITEFLSHLQQLSWTWFEEADLVPLY
jgi:hypothetical protein